MKSKKQQFVELDSEKEQSTQRKGTFTHTQAPKSTGKTSSYQSHKRPTSSYKRKKSTSNNSKFYNHKSKSRTQTPSNSTLSTPNSCKSSKTNKPKSRNVKYVKLSATLLSTSLPRHQPISSNRNTEEAGRGSHRLSQRA